MSSRINFYNYYGTRETILQTAFHMQANGAATFYRASIIEKFVHLKNFYIKLNTAKASGKPFSPNLISIDILDLHFELIPDYVKICIFFENFMKSVLLQQEFLIHSILKTDNCKLLAKKQNRQPVSLVELHNTEAFIVSSSSEIFHNSLGEKTISISTLLCAEYQKVIQLPAEVAGFIIQLNKKRNILHSYNDLDFELSDDFFKNMADTISFVNMLFNKDKDSYLN